MKNSHPHTYIKIFHTILIVLCAVSFFSCVKVDLCTEEEHPHTGNVLITYHWPEGATSIPDSMLVLANRIINTRRVGYVTGKENSLGGRYRFGKEYLNEGTIVSEANDMYPLIVSAGEYQIFAFNNEVVSTNKESIDANTPDYRLEGLQEYSLEEHFATVGIRDLGISYVGRNLEDPRLDKYKKDWIEEFNGYTQYIASDIKPIYRAMNHYDETTQEYTVDVRANGKVEIDLYPQRITQDITFSFPIYVEKAEKEVVIDSIIAEISGIPRKMMIYSGVIVADTTYKMLFPIRVDYTNTQEVTLMVEEDGNAIEKPFIQTECVGDISVMGLMANQDPHHRTGAGILVLCIYAHTTNDAGEEKTKTQYVKINLYNTIRQAHLLIKNEQGEIMQNPGTDPDKPYINTLRIDGSRLMLTRDLILKTSDDDVSVDTWIKPENGDINIDA